MLTIDERVLVVTNEDAETGKEGAGAIRSWRTWTCTDPEYEIRVQMPDRGRDAAHAVEMRELLLRIVFALSGENGEIHEYFPEGGGQRWGGQYTKTITQRRREAGEHVGTETSPDR
jgi:hypothetical protein